MEKYRAIPDGYMRVGELAKKVGINTNTLRYYEKEGLLLPASKSEGGYRLYSDKDMVRLIQILMMKQFGFTLNEIKKRLTSLDTPSDVVNMLAEHTVQIRRKVKQLTESLDEIEAFKAEITQMESVDFKKFAVILESLKMKNTNSWMIKYFDDDIIKLLTEGTEAMSREKVEALFTVMYRFFDEALKLQEENVAPDSEKGLEFAKEFWELVMEMADGNMGFMQTINEQVLKVANSHENQSAVFLAAHRFITSALTAYFTGGSINHEEGELLIGKTNNLFHEAAKLQAEKVMPESGKAQKFAKKYWEAMMEITGGNLEMLQKMNDQYVKALGSEKKPDRIPETTHHFIESALKIYFDNQQDSSEGEM